MMRSIPLIVCLFGICFGRLLRQPEQPDRQVQQSQQPQQPCQRLARLIGNYIEFMRDDRNLNKATHGMMRRQVEDTKERILEQIGKDITKQSDREEIACTLLGLENLREFFAVVKGTQLGEGVSFPMVCQGYRQIVHQADEAHEMFTGEFWDDIYTFASDLSAWMNSTGFPQQFPPEITYLENVKALEEMVNKIDSSSDMKMTQMRNIMSELLPVGLQNKDIKWMKLTTTTPEEVAGWMEESKNIFEYASNVADLDPNFDVEDFVLSYGSLEVYRQSYDTLLWYKEIVEIISESNIFSLDTAGCPDMQRRFRRSARNADINLFSPFSLFF